MTVIQKLLDEINNAEFECRNKYGCRNGLDCQKCELLPQGCVKKFVAKRLLEKFNISVKGGKEND